MKKDWKEFGSAEKRKAAQKILNYLKVNPEAMDTEEGIARWWLGEELENMQDVLSPLIDHGILSIKILNNQRYYFLSAACRRDPEAMPSML